MDNIIPDNAVTDIQSPQAVSAAPTAMPAQAPMQALSTQPPTATGIPDDAVTGIQTPEEKYTTPGQKVIAGLEGLSKGVIPFGGAQWLERYIGVPAEDIRQREEYNPYTEGGAQTVGLLGSIYTGAGLGKLMTGAGEAAQAATGLAELGEKAPYLARVGSSAVEQAAQMAVLAGSDEAAKMAYDDAPASAENAIANIGLSAALGGAAGAFVTGAVSPLWKATLGKEGGKFLNALKYMSNGSKPLMEAVTTPEKQAITLVHYSPNELKVIDPAFSGMGADARVNGRGLEEKISHYYIKDAPRSEADRGIVYGAGQNEHEVTIDPSKDRIYDYSTDPEGILSKALEETGGVAGNARLDVANRMLKQMGYSGFTVSKNLENPNTVMMFKPMPVSKINGMKVDTLPKNFSMISSQIGTDVNPARQAELKQRLEDLGYKVNEAEGHYGGTAEPSFMVEHSGSTADKKVIDELGKEYGQESVLHSTEVPQGRHNELRFSSGQPSLYGMGYLPAHEAETNYTASPLFGKFQLNIGSKTNPLTVKRAVRQSTKAVIKEVRDEDTQELMRQAANTAYASATDEESPLHTALNELGIDLTPLMRARMSGDPQALQWSNELLEAMNPQMMAEHKELPIKVRDALMEKMGIPFDDVAHYSNNLAGQDVYSTFEKEYNQHYAPVAKAMEERDAAAAPIRVPDEERRKFGAQILERGMKSVETDSPYYKLYEDAAHRVMAKDTIGGLDKYKTELYNKAKSLSVDNNEKMALHDIRNMVSDFQDRQLESEAYRPTIAGKAGVGDAAAIRAQRAAANKQYRDFHTMSNELTDNLGVGNFKGAGTLKDKLEGMAPEDLLKKFSPRGNADAIPFLDKYFPETAKKVQEAETKKFLSPAVSQKEGESVLDVKKINKQLESLKKGSPEYANFVMHPDVQRAIQAAQTILDHNPGIKSSGTAGWMHKLLHAPISGAISTVGILMGHNPVAAYLLSELAQKMSTNATDAVKLAALKYMGSSKPVSAPAFKATVEALENAMQGHLMIQRAAMNVLKPGSQVVATSAAKLVAQREKLNKIIEENQNNPDKIMSFAQNSQVGHYMPQHQAALQQTTASQIQYLQSLKPQPFKSSPLGREIEPDKAAEARYNRALDIANDPTVVLQHVKDGSVQVNDIKDLQSLYPNLYQQMVKQLSSEVAEHTENDGQVPYKTRMGISLFMSTPMDSTMQPQNIMAAQPMPQVPPQPPQKPMKGRQGKSAINKMPNSYKTPGQAAESDRSNRD